MIQLMELPNTSTLSMVLVGSVPVVAALIIIAYLNFSK